MGRHQFLTNCLAKRRSENQHGPFIQMFSTPSNASRRRGIGGEQDRFPYSEGFPNKVRFENGYRKLVPSWRSSVNERLN
jgi:hypothetical protein